MMAHRFLGAVIGTFALTTAALAGPGDGTLTFAVMRNGTQIGTNSIKFGHDGADITVEDNTHIAVGLGSLVLYRYDQNETERWTDGRLVAFDAKTDNNGHQHNTSAKAKDGRLVIHADDKVSDAPPTTVPLSLWNPVLVGADMAVDPEDGSVRPIKVLDRGLEKLAIQGKTRSAHHYQIVTNFPQDVWYDDNNQLVQVELKGSDGSTIRYQLM